MFHIDDKKEVFAISSS